MQYLRSMKKIFIVLATLILLSGILYYLQSDSSSTSNFSFGSRKDVYLKVGQESTLEIEKTSAQTVCELLEDEGVTFTDTHKIIPPCTTRIKEGMTIEVLPERSLTVIVDGQQEELKHYGQDDLNEILEQNAIILGQDDIIEPTQKSPPENSEVITITRVEVSEVQDNQRIFFQEVVNEDDQMGVGEQEVTTEGVEGQKQVRYKITYHDGEEVSKEIIEEKIVKEKVDRVVTKGTRPRQESNEVSTADKKEEHENKDSEEVKLGKSHTGQSSWYAYKGCDCAANPWLPKGSRVKVTAVNSGRSVIVTINDRGPFVEGRIIDLDKTAFEKIAPLGAGVVDVKMEEVIE